MNFKIEQELASLASASNQQISSLCQSGSNVGRTSVQRPLANTFERTSVGAIDERD